MSLPDIDRWPGTMTTQELDQQAEHIEAVLSRYPPRLSLAGVLISYAAEIRTVLYERENREREPGQLTSAELRECLGRLAAVSAAAP